MVPALLSTSALAEEKDVVKTWHSGSLQRTEEFDVNIYGSLPRQPGYLQICVCAWKHTQLHTYTWAPRHVDLPKRKRKKIKIKIVVSDVQFGSRLCPLLRMSGHLWSRTSPEDMQLLPSGNDKELEDPPMSPSTPSLPLQLAASKI